MKGNVSEKKQSETLQEGGTFEEANVRGKCAKDVKKESEWSLRFEFRDAYFCQFLFVNTISISISITISIGICGSI